MVEKQRSSKSSQDFCLLKAQTFIQGKGARDIDPEVKDSFTSLAKLMTALLSEINRTYVTSQTPKDKKMRKRINQTIALVNNY